MVKNILNNPVVGWAALVAAIGFMAWHEITSHPPLVREAEQRINQDIITLGTNLENIAKEQKVYTEKLTGIVESNYSKTKKDLGREQRNNARLKEKNQELEIQLRGVAPLEED